MRSAITAGLHGAGRGEINKKIEGYVDLMDWGSLLSVLLSGFAGAIIGAVIAYKGLMRVVNRQEDTRRKNAIANIIMELTENLHAGKMGNPTTPIKFTSGSWDIAKGDIMSMISDSEVLTSFRELYSRMKKANNIIDRMNADPNSRGLGNWDTAYETSLKEVAEKITETLVRFAESKEGKPFLYSLPFMKKDIDELRK